MAARPIPLLVLFARSDVGAEDLPELVPFMVGVTVFAFQPFGLLVALAGTSPQSVGGAAWPCASLNALAYYEIFRPDQTDGQG